MDTTIDSKICISSLKNFSPFSNIEVDLLRLDLIHEKISGNKWFKLKPFLTQAQLLKKDTLMTMGGARSNHLYATAFAAKCIGLKSEGFVRGTWNENQLSSTLSFCKKNGMTLKFVSAEVYKNLREHQPSTADHALWIPEGGESAMAEAACSEINELIPEKYTHIAASVGTGTTAIGIGKSLKAHQQLIGFAPMKNGQYLKEKIAKRIGKNASQFEFNDQWHLGGFGKRTDALHNFYQDFLIRFQIELDLVYTAKMMFGIEQMLHSKYWPSGSKILAIHTGGIQGNAPF